MGQGRAPTHTASTAERRAAWALAAALCLSACAAATTLEDTRPLPPHTEARTLEDARPLHLDESVWSLLGTRVLLEADPVNQQVEVTLSLDRPPSPLDVQIPQAWAGQIDIGRDFRDLRATCDGASLSIELIDNGRMRLVHQGCRQIAVRYRILIDRGLHAPANIAHRRRSRLDATGLVLHGPATLALPWDVSGGTPLGLGAGGVAVEVIAPASWEVGATWRPVHVPGAPLPSTGEGRAVWRFLAHDLGQLVDSVVVGGKLRHQSADLPDGRLLHLLTLGELPLSDDALRQTLERIVAAQARFLPKGWAWPAGTERLTVVALSSGDAPLLEGGGRRGGFIVEIGAGAQPVEVAELIAHETFHVVNGHLLVHQPQAEFDTLWFKEGVTTWIAALTLVRAGLADEAWLLARLGELAETYYGNPLSTHLSMARVEPTFWRDVHTRRLPYDKGALLGLLLDASLTTSDPEAPTALEAWFAWLLERVAQRGLAYDNATLQAGVAAIGGETRETAALFERYVYGVEPLPLQDALSRLDLRLQRGMAPAPYYGLDLGNDARGAFVAHLDPAGPAARLGLLLGDRLQGEPHIPQHRTDAPAHVNLLRLGRVVPMTIYPERGLRERYTITPTAPICRLRRLL